MADLVSVSAAIDSTDLRRRFEAATFLAAIVIRNESSTVANHAERASWAGRVVSNERVWKASAWQTELIGLGYSTAFNTNGTGIDDPMVSAIVTAVLAAPAMLRDIAASV